MLRKGKYADYKGKIYRVSRITDNKIRLVSYDKADESKGFKLNLYPDNYLDKEQLPVTYVKEVNLEKVNSLFDMMQYVMYKGIKFNVEDENNKFYYIGTGDSELANKLNFNRTDKYYYEKWVPKSEAELIESRKDLK